MNILNLAYTDIGGAGKASLYFHELFLEAGHNSAFMVKESKLSNPGVILLKPASGNIVVKFIKISIARLLKLANRLKQHAIDKKYAFYNLNESITHTSASEILRKIPFVPEVIVLHWVSNFINAKTVEELATQTGAKVFWLMIDNAPLTGGCHYPWDCVGYQYDCSNCPAVLKESLKVLVKNNLEFKQKHLPVNITLITGSESDYQHAVSSSLFKDKTKIYKLLFPIDSNRYIIGDKAKAREAFIIQKNKKVIFLGALSNYNPRKGLQYFLEAISILEKEIEQKGLRFDDYLILIAGKVEAISFYQIRIPILFTGYLTEDKLIEAYQAADVFVSSSIQDSGPLMINQSIMCGTPVVAFEIGVALDLVITEQTGYLANMKDSEDLANGITFILELDEQQRNKITNNCRNIGLKLCHHTQQISKFVELFDK